MLKNKKILLVVSLVVLASIILSGCGGSDPVNQSTLMQQANNTIDNYNNSLENEDVSSMSQYLDSTFQHQSGSTTMTKDEYTSMIQLAFNLGAEFHNLTINNRLSEVINDNKVRVSGSLYTEATNVNGVYYTDSFPVQYTVEKKNNTWLLTYIVD